MQMPVSRLEQVNSVAGDSFFYQKFGPATVELYGGLEGADPPVDWGVHIHPDKEGYYKCSLNVEKLSGDVSHVQIYCGITVVGPVFISTGTNVCCVVYFDPAQEHDLAISAAMFLEDARATVRVNGFISRWN